MKNNFDITVVGSGFFGATIANLFASKLGKKVLVLEKRNHPGGNSWSEIDATTQIEYHPYGSHLFHTSNKNIWDYVNSFDKFSSYQHRVWSNFQNQLLPIPVNLQTINMIYGSFFNPTQARDLLNSEIEKDRHKVNPETLEGKAILTFGRKIYESLIKGYTQKQWQTDPNSLPAATINRIPLRFNLDCNYFDDTYQGLPLSGYNSLISNMLDDKNITLELNVDFFKVRDKVVSPLVVYTGPVDKYFDYQFQPLLWRTLDFVFEIHKSKDFQGCAVINDPSPANQFTRIHEFKHLHPERSYNTDFTLIAKEFSRFAEFSDEPYYPVNSFHDKDRLSKYRKLVSLEEKRGTFFGGRLASYKYLDMHMAIASAHTLFNSLRNYS